LAEEGLQETQEHMFQQRKKAAKWIYEKMDDKEKQEIRTMVEVQAESGNAREIRER
jgi:hypothetical protein